MRKVFILTVVILFILLVGTLGYFMRENKTLISYTQLEYKTPDDFGSWKKTVFQNGIQIYQNSDDKAIIMFALPTPAENNFKIDSWEKAIKKDKEQCEKLEIIKIDKFKINSYEASEYINECEKDLNIYKMRNVLIVNNNNKFQLGLSAPKNDYDKNNVIFEKIVNSVIWK